MFIYKIANKINQKQYIGQTVRAVTDRWREHKQLCESGDTRHLYCAMRKYGVDNFEIETIDRAQNQAELSEKEIFWIAKLDTYNNGYNMTIGGDVSPMLNDKTYQKHLKHIRSPEVRQKISESMKKRLKEHPRSAEYRKKLSEAAKGNQKYKGKKRPQHAIEACSKALAKKVYCIDENNNIVNEFDYVRDAAKWWAQELNRPLDRYHILMDAIKRSAKNDRYIHGIKWIYK